MKFPFVTAAAVFAFAAGATAVPLAGLVEKSVSSTSDNNCSRECMTTIVDQILASMLLHNPEILPLAQTYYATENSHPAALGMMTLWRTVTSAGSPSLLAIDTTSGSAYFALDISEGSDTKQSVLWARIKVVNKEITELELYVNRSRGDHGFSFSAAELPENYERWMSPPSDRQNATREVLESLSAATFNPNSTLSVTVADDCQFTEEGWSVIDPGPDGDGSTTPLGCSWPDSRPADTNARLNLVIDEQNGIVVTGAIIPGKVYPYGKISAFIPNDMTEAQEQQDEWLAKKKASSDMSLLAPTAATGETLQVLQYYNGKLQGQQVMLYLSGPDMKSAWSA
ncbi:uncharacterized protein N7496_000128 [Penicillium cataractarum]|uniref:Uncharacterized protein n=1 Tax=Penicillium cataractarum TaxID=2100454 RepID=A0A9X0B5P3_9EURO|nr:uncharacterized protein N7496_000128 [Penicillium cataractarum]KAJ5389060.1 hypothetical protein N7496_000128 [Penicillium cataractarum]